MQMPLIYILTVIPLIKFYIANADLQNDISIQMENNNFTYLSRNKRYLMFPAGSSFQLVFCLTYPSVGVGSYFVFGHTAAVAYELPSMRLFYDQRDFQKKEEEPAETTTTEMPEIDFSELNHERIDNFYPSKGAYQRPQIDYYSNTIYDDNRYYKEYMAHKSHMRLKMDPKYYLRHRRTRRELYKKLENFLNTINLNGKECLLKSICEMSKSADEKGSFLEELFKAVFRVKPHDEYEDEDEYDAAFNLSHDCAEKYRSCPGSLKNVQLLVRK